MLVPCSTKNSLVLWASSCLSNQVARNDTVICGIPAYSSNLSSAYVCVLKVPLGFYLQIGWTDLVPTNILFYVLWP